MKQAVNPVVEMLAAQLHKEYRAAFIAMHSGFSTFMGVGRQKRNFGTGCRNEHDHGWSNCTKKKYFLRRAKMHIKNSQIDSASTLGETECALAALVLLRRLNVEDKLRIHLVQRPMDIGSVHIETHGNPVIARAVSASQKAIGQVEKLGCGCTVNRGWRCPTHSQP